MANQPNLDELMKMAQKMQTSMKSAHDELAAMRIKGESGGGVVKVTINGKHQCLRVRVDEDFLEKEICRCESGKGPDVEILEDLIAAAINDATNKVEKAAQEKMMGLSKELGLPEDFKLPEINEEKEDGGSGTKSGGGSSSFPSIEKKDDDDDDGDDGFGGFGSKKT